MKFINRTILLSIFSIAMLHGQVIYQSKSTVDFTELGYYTVEQSTWTTPEQMRSDEKTQFKGRGIIKGTLAKLLLRSGETGQIMQPLQKRIVGMDHKEKEYWITPIMEMNLDSLKDMTDIPETDEEMPDDSLETEPRDSDIEIIRHKFVVNKTGDKKSINNFDCELYDIFWVMEWRRKSTGETGTDSLHTAVWTTPQTDEMRKAQEIQMEFAKTELGAMGIDLEEMQRENMLGLKWLEILAQTNQQKSRQPDMESPEWVSELQKLEGYPIVVDGKYFAIRPQPEGEENAESASSDPTDVKGAIGGFMKKKLFGKKKEDEGPKPAIAYMTEVEKYELQDFNNDVFEISSKYKERMKKK